jgi:hypothetical protein
MNSWYYVILFGARAMAHAATEAELASREDIERVWSQHVLKQQLVLSPFSPFVSSLVTAQSSAELSKYRGSNRFDLNQVPCDEDQAWGATVSYLNGTAEYERWRAEEEIKTSPAFLALGVTDFRRKVARELRDEVLAQLEVNFLVEANRYRGKANYRDSLFLSYGNDYESQIETFLVDLCNVAESFLKMTSAYCSRRVESGVWEEFLADLEGSSRLSIEPDVLRV